MIGSFTIQGRLGRGAMGAVYLARSPGGRLVAVKVVRDELAGDAAFRARFAREIEAARKVSGAFTAAVVDADPDADIPGWPRSTCPDRRCRRRSTRPDRCAGRRCSRSRAGWPRR